MTKEYETFCEMQQEYRSFVQLNYIPLHNHLYTLTDDIFAAPFLRQYGLIHGRHCSRYYMRSIRASIHLIS
jgi:hypothetical protein